MNTTNMETDDVIDDIILDLTTEDLFQEVGDPARDSTPTPSAPSVLQPMADHPHQPSQLITQATGMCRL